MATAPPGHIPPRPSTPPTGRETTFISQQVQPPSPLYLQPEDSLHLTIDNPTLNLAGLQGLLTIRFLRPDGEITLTVSPIALQAPQTGASFDFHLGEGFILSATFNAPFAANAAGGVYVVLSVQRGFASQTATGWTLFADYVNTRRAASWPYGRSMTPQEGGGRLRSITGTTPAAGAEITEVVPASVRWLLLTGSMTLSTSAVAANRDPVFIVDDGVNILYRWNTTAVITASSVSRLTFSTPNQAGTVDGTGQLIFIPTPLFLPPSCRFRTLTGSIQAADQYSAPQYLVQEWAEL